MQKLDTFKKMVDELKSTNSRNEKMEILAKYPENQPLLQIVMDPFKKFNVTKKSILKYAENFDPSDIKNTPPTLLTEDLIYFLDSLASRQVSGKEALACCDYITRMVPDEYTDLLLCIFNKNLEIRIGDKEINKVFPNLIPTFDVCLAQSSSDKLLDKIRNEPDEWCIMRKLDGLRCATEFYLDKSTSKSRNGNIFTSLKKVNDAVENMMAKYPNDVVFDGEICVVDDEGNEDFSKAVSQVKKKDKEMAHPKYIIFDVIPYDDFQDKVSLSTYFDRLDRAKALVEAQNSPYIDIIKVMPFTDDNYQLMRELRSQEGWEGLMLRKNVGYEGKRTKNLLKVKEFFTEEFKVIGHNTGPFRAINEETGLEETIKTLTSVSIMYKDKYLVEVGSGFSLAQRKEFFEHPDRILEKTITVQYFEESKNKQGGLSLRFPTMKHIWENGRDA